MHLFDAPWISHDGGNIFSVDLHLNGTKLATAGQDGGGAGLLVIWDLDFISSSSNLSNDSTTPPPECNYYNPMARIPHSSSINCVRWSKNPDEKRLVCAGDDPPVLCIYNCTGVYSSMGSIAQHSSSSSRKNVVEIYRCTHKLYGHTLDVLHLDWSPDGRYLASCSLDNTIIIWNVLKLPEKIAILRELNGGHSRGVKGLAWDPAGKFLASQAEDNSLKIWRTDNWICVRTFTKPFSESAISTLFCRMDWSPDGCYLLAPCAMNNGGPTAKIFVRKDWTHERDLVGFRKAVSCVRSNPQCFQVPIVRSNPPNPYYSERMNGSGTHSTTISCFAIGSRDRSVSVWLIPNFARPVMVLENLFKDSVIDLTWSRLTLAACSRDGVVRIIKFSENEIGHLLSEHETASIRERLYGIQSNLNSHANVPVQNGEVSVDFGYTSQCETLTRREQKLHRVMHNGIPPKRRISTSLLMRHTTGEHINNLNNSHVEEFAIQQADECRPRQRMEDGEQNQQLFELPERRRLLHAKLEDSGVNLSAVHSVEVINNYPLNSCSECARISAYNREQKQPKWTFFSPRILSILTANRKWTLLASFDAHFTVFSTQTGRLIFAVCLDEPLSIVQLQSNDDNTFLTIGIAGTLSVWDIPNKRRLTVPGMTLNCALRRSLARPRRCDDVNHFDLTHRTARADPTNKPIIANTSVKQVFPTIAAQNGTMTQTTIL